ncbi:MAG TPA: 1-(5-phosphoribosyl)-5-[(5-phosphoribosylamino)methylideneamino]imidazole-4-carboxamide isomerase [Candidatus Fimivicinus intestinavium]|nr:1-(5-phosphoribosyl)-5-[(5-phosphoribosylamino)methylideneamino]imidazole-4-carboxamide isomerase [Candidatus Fimivicinus intestinavium]
MLIFPAIDIKNGACVRLYQGEMSTAEQVADSALEAAKRFRADGASWVHMVDLDGAVAGERKNTGIFLEVAQASGLKVEVGGGIRTMADIAFYLENGIARVILGSVALRDASLVRQAVAAFGAQIAVGIDARDGMVAAEGWVETSRVSDVELAKRMEEAGVQCLICTDIARDGMLSGPNLEQLTRIRQAVKCDIVASGGVTNLGDIVALRDCGLYGAICGRSIYKGTLSLREAIRTADAG